MTLPPELEVALLREIARTYDTENWTRFGSRLTQPLLALSDDTSRLGAWRAQPRRIEISRSLVVERPWPELVEVLKHEMAHQYVSEVLGVVDETAHGETFRRVCAQRGIDARAAGLVAAGTADDRTARLIDRVQKLLALAGSSERHEAEAAMRKAHELMLRHNLEVPAATGGYELRHLGDPRRRRTRAERDVVHILTTHFFVNAIEIPSYLPALGRQGTVFEIGGTRPNVEMAEHAFAFLVATAERLWQSARRERALPGTERTTYQSGVVRGFGEKLVAERGALRGAGLVWVGDPGLDDFHRKRHPRIQTFTTRSRVGASHALGRAAGRDVVLHRPMHTGGAGDTKLLGPG